MPRGGVHSIMIIVVLHRMIWKDNTDTFQVTAADGCLSDIIVRVGLLCSRDREIYYEGKEFPVIYHSLLPSENKYRNERLARLVYYPEGGHTVTQTRLPGRS